MPSLSRVPLESYREDGLLLVASMDWKWLLFGARKGPDRLR